MNRRNFLSLLGMSVGGLALDQAIPFNRVWSFPSKIVVPETLCFSREAFSFYSPELFQQWRTGVVTERFDTLFGYGKYDPYSSGELAKVYGFESDNETSVSSHAI